MSWFTRMEGFVILVVTNIIAIIMVIFGGLILGGIYNQLFSQGFLAKIPSDWQTAGDLFNMMHLYYYACIMIAAAGWLIFAMSIYQKEGIDTQRSYYYGR